VVNKLTRTQKELYYCVYDFILWNKQSPTLGELSQKIGKDKSNICRILHRIEKKGYIEIEKQKIRGIKVINDVNNIKLY